MTTSNSRHPKVISLVEPCEETCDGKAERKDGTGHRFDGRRRPAGRSQARASRRACWCMAVMRREVLASSPTSRPVAAFLAADLSALAEVRRLADAAQATVDRLDILINNAGIGTAGPRQTSAEGSSCGLRSITSPAFCSRCCYCRLSRTARQRGLSTSRLPDNSRSTSAT